MAMDYRLTRCVACASEETRVETHVRGYRLRRCSVCGLTFTENPRYHPKNYRALYEGAHQEAPLPPEWQFVYTAPLRNLVNEVLAWWRPTPWLSAAEYAALRWLRRHLPKGARILDIGCGPGRFLRAARKAGWDAIGIDVDSHLVALLRRSGLPAFVGALPDIPWEGPAPQAVTLFEVLEHLPEPELFLKPLQRQFPEAVVLVSVPSPFRPEVHLWGKRYPYDYPPHHYLHWTPQALERFFQRMGYRQVTVVLPKPLGSEHIEVQLTLLRWFGQQVPNTAILVQTLPKRLAWSTRLTATLTVLGVKATEKLLNLVLGPWAWWAARRGASGLSMLAIAQP